MTPSKYMEVKTSRAARVVLAIVLGYLGVAVVGHVFSVPDQAGNVLPALGVAFLLVAAFSYALSTIVEALAVRAGVPVERGIDLFYAAVPFVILWQIGVTIGFWVLASQGQMRRPSMIAVYLSGLVFAAGAEYLLQGWFTPRFSVPRLR